MTLQGKGKKNETLKLHTGPIRSHAEDTSANHTPNREEIRLRAYEIYLERGGLTGNEFDDWLQAGREPERAAPPKADEFSIKRETQGNGVTSSKTRPVPQSRWGGHVPLSNQGLPAVQDPHTPSHQ